MDLSLPELPAKALIWRARKINCEEFEFYTGVTRSKHRVWGRAGNKARFGSSALCWLERKMIESSEVKWKSSWSVQEYSDESRDHHLVNGNEEVISRDLFIEVIGIFAQSEYSIRKYGCKGKINSILWIKVVFL